MFFQQYKFTSYTERREIRFKILRILVIVFLIFVFQQLIRSYIISTYRMQAETMQPSFRSGDMMITAPFYGAQKNIERGTLVVVEPIEKPARGFFPTVLQQVISFFYLSAG